ncbi:hypothetical protein ACU8DI_13900 [Psychroserpens sp. BH13MA-6]
MKQYLKTTVIIMCLGIIVICSKSIQNYASQNYEYYINQLAGNTLANTNPIGL